VDPKDQSQGGEPRMREARLRTEFAHLYPPLEAGRWESAALMADRLVAWLLRQPDRGYIAPERVLRSEHFEFRGGTSTAGSKEDTQRRRNHPKPRES
jgi:hypothetical protein